MNFENEIIDKEWDVSCVGVSSPDDVDVIICHAKVNNLVKISKTLVGHVLDKSWMMKIDPAARRSYNITVQETAERLVEVFNAVAETSRMSKKFGETMVSMASAKALETLFNHRALPLAELWKPQAGQNEGFDFHTECDSHLINYGEAKYSSTSSPHLNAIRQASEFIDQEKHFRDRVHLIELASPDGIHNLDNDDFGVVAAFSVNANNSLAVYQNALNNVMEIFPKGRVRVVYLIGVEVDG